MSTSVIERHEVCSFSREVVDAASRSLKLLRDIEHTLSWLGRLRAQIVADATFAEDAAEFMNDLDTPFDESGDLVRNLDAAQEAVESMYHALIDKREAGRRDRALRSDDGIEEAYSDTIAAAADLYNGLNTLRWAIMEHDADVGPRDETGAAVFSNADDLGDFLAKI